MSLTKATYSMIEGSPVNVLDKGADPSGANDSTTAIQLAIDEAAIAGKWVYVPAGTYKLIPNTTINDEDTSYVTKVCFLIRSNMRIWAEPGATFRIANNVSTDASPKSMGMFGTDTPQSNVTIQNLIMDMNGANNKISPNRPTSYNRYNQSPILVSGQPGAAIVARLDNVLIENCTFQNNPGACDIVCSQSNTAGVPLGRNWRILNNNFLNNGLDTDDHTAVFAWADDIEFSGNLVSNAVPFASVGRTGGNTCYEVHGNRHRVTNNIFENYYRGIWVSSNLTDAEVQDTVIANNDFKTNFYGVDFFRTVSTLGRSSNTVIEGNSFRFDDYTFPAPVPSEKVAVQIAAEYSQGSALINGNSLVSTDDVVGAIFFQCVSQGVAAQEHTDIVVSNNKAEGARSFASVDTGAGVNPVGSIVFENNTFIEPVLDPAHTVGIGIYIEPTTSIKTLKISGNNFIDERSPSKLDYGVYIAPGTIDYLYYVQGAVKNINTAAYYESSPVTITVKDGIFDQVIFTPTWSMSGTPITVGNGSSLGVYSIQGNLVTVSARLTIGSTTVIPAGTIYLNLPFTAALSSYKFLGAGLIFDSAPTPKFHNLVSNVDGTATIATLTVEGATLATQSSPVTLAAGDSINLQVTYYRT